MYNNKTSLVTPPPWCVVFDLDDTLYKEADYQRSGLLAIADLLETLHHINARPVLFELLASQTPDIIGNAIIKLGLPITLKESLLWYYRLHTPDIRLNDETQEVLSFLRAQNIPVVILTDGRSVTQRLKLTALGLSDYPVYISDEWDGSKPAPERFKILMTQYPEHRFMYIGDNPQKDFICPKQMGWKTIGIRGDEQNIHPQPNDQLPHLAPEHWITSITELEGLLC